MIRIDCFTRDGCDACKIAIKNITDAINEANCDITLNIRCLLYTSPSPRDTR